MTYYAHPVGGPRHVRQAYFHGAFVVLLDDNPAAVPTTLPRDVFNRTWRVFGKTAGFGIKYREEFVKPIGGAA